MATEATSLPQTKKVKLSDGREIEVRRPKVFEVAEVMKAARESGFKLEGKGDLATALVSYPEIYMALVESTTDLTAEDVGRLEVADGILLVSTALEVTDLLAIARQLKNSVRLVWEAVLEMLPQQARQAARKAAKKIAEAAGSNG